MEAILESIDGKPFVLTRSGIFPLGCCQMSKHSDGSNNFNMSYKGKYTAYKEGEIITGFLTNKKEFIPS